MALSNLPATFNGAKWHATHQASVDTILTGTGISRRVFSRGSRFYNRDAWTARFVLGAMQTWAKRYPGKTPTWSDVDAWVKEANDTQVEGQHIVIAATPLRLTRRVALALAGGGHHEALHSLYSCRRRITTSEVWDMIESRWDKADWAKLGGLLREFCDIIEDVRIERRGCEQFPGISMPMSDLQDFVLSQEQESRLQAYERGATKADVWTPLSVITMSFRDLGLGYNTLAIRNVLKERREAQPDAYTVVTDGPLSPVLREAIALSTDDDLGFLRVSMDAVIVLRDLADSMPDEAKDQASEMACPSCGAPPSKLRLRPKRVNGKRVKGAGIIRCTVCSHEQEIEFNDSDDQDQDGESEATEIQVEDWDDAGDESEGDESEGSGGEGDEEGDEEGSGGEGDEEGSADEEDSEGDESEGSDDDSEEGADDTESSSDSPEGGVGETPDEPWSDAANDLLDQIENGEESGRIDQADALSEAFEEAREDESDVEGNEMEWRPWDASGDLVQLPPHTLQDNANADRILSSVKREVSYLRARLRQIVRASEQTETDHGVKKGRRLSRRNLVHSRMCLTDGRAPTRAFQEAAEQPDTSIAAAISLDQSSSTRSLKAPLTKAMFAIAEPIDHIGGATMAFGWRDGGRLGGSRRAITEEERKDPMFRQCHRNGSINYDVFKGWEEKFAAVKGRMTKMQSIGGTPMADGIEFGLRALSDRPEGHRILFVVTDGCPTGNARSVMPSQFRRAKKAGVHVIGVGVGPGTEYVRDVFPDHVFAQDIGDLPRLLVAKLNQLLDFSEHLRGRRVS